MTKDLAPEQMVGVLARPIKEKHRRWPKVLIGLVLIDGLAVSVMQAFPNIAVATANLINFQSNGLAQRSSQTVYSGLTIDKLPAEQQQDISFTDNNYVGSLKDITSYSNQNQKLYLQGYISVPNLGIYQPIYYGTSNTVLANGAGTVKDGQKMGEGNYGVSAHNMGSYANWIVPVPSVSGAYIKPGSYFTALQSGTPGAIYTTDGEYIYTFKQANKQRTNLGNSNVLSDDYPYDRKEYSYTIKTADGLSTGRKATDTGLGLGSQKIDNETVGQFKLSGLNRGDADTIYTVRFKTNSKYADKLSNKSFELGVRTDGETIPNVKAKVKEVKVENGEVVLLFNLTGDVESAFATMGAYVQVDQIEAAAYITLTTCVVDNNAPSPNRIVDTGVLVDKIKFSKADKVLQHLFPDVVNTRTAVSSASQGNVKPQSNVKLNWWQKIVQWIGHGLLAQNDVLNKLQGRK